MSAQPFSADNGFSTPGNIVSGSYFIGDGSNLSGTVPTANVAYSVSAANVSGTVATATTAGTVTTNAQPNITSVGNLTALNVTGDITSGNSISVGTLAFYGDYVASITANGNIEIGTTGTGEVQVEANGFSVTTTTNPNPVFDVDGMGQVKILTPTFDANTGAVSIVGSSSGNYISPTNAGAMLHITGQPATPARVYVDSEASYGLYVGRRFNGNVTNPTAVNAGDSLVRFAANPYIGSNTNAGFTALGTTSIRMTATENQSVTNQGSQVEFWVTPQGSNVINQAFTIANTGVYFQDGTFQATAGIPLSYYGNANGVATLNASGQIPAAQLPAGAVVYIGTWDASTNTPTLTNGVGTAGYEYSVSVGGTVDFGAGNITFNQGDFVIYTAGNTWAQIPGVVSVASFNGRTGAVTLQANDVISAQGYTSYNGNTNPNGYVNAAGAAAAAPVQSFNTRAGAVTLQSSDVTTALTSGSLINAKLANSNVVLGNTTATLGTTVANITGLTNVSTSTLAVSGNTTSGNITVSGATTTKDLIFDSGPYNIGNSSTAFTLDFNNGSLQTVNITGAATITLANAQAGKVCTLILTNSSGTNRNIVTGTSAANSTTGTNSIAVNNGRIGMWQYVCPDNTTANVRVGFM